MSLCLILTVDTFFQNDKFFENIFEIYIFSSTLQTTYFVLLLQVFAFSVFGTNRIEMLLFAFCNCLIRNSTMRSFLDQCNRRTRLLLTLRLKRIFSPHFMHFPFFIYLARALLHWCWATKFLTLISTKTGKRIHLRVSHGRQNGEECFSM